MAGYPCGCRGQQTCGGWCPDGPPAQLQVTVTDPTWEAGSETYPCSETQCDDRIGVFLLNLRTAAQATTEWYVGNGTFDPAEHCLWRGTPFTACFRYDDLWEPPGSLPPVLTEHEFVYQAQYDAGLLYVWLLDLTNLTNFHVAWRVDVTEVTCGDTIPALDYYGAGSELGAAFCTLDETEQVTVEIPP